MELDDLKELMHLLKDTDVTELQIEKDGMKVRLKRDRFLGRLEFSPAPVVERHEPRKELPDTEAKLFTVTSPIVGTFYRAPAPDAAPFVEVGTSVKRGQALCVIEAMKLMNEIESEVDGVIVRVLVENGHPVEYGEPLFLVEPL